MRGIAVVIAVVMMAGCQQAPSDTPSQETHPAEAQSAAPTKPEQGGAVVTASIGDASNLIPMLAGDNASHTIAGLIYPGLVRYNEKWEIEPDLAETFEVKNDGKTIIFHLRKDVTWQDGEPFTSADVMFGFNTITDPATPTPYSEDYLQVAKAEAPDAHTFIVHYDKPYAPALASWGSLVVIPKHLLEGKKITESELTRKPVGIGPFKFKDWQVQQRIELTAEEKYFEGRPYVNRFVFRIIPDQATQFLELKSGGIDEMGLTPIQFAKQTHTKQFEQEFQKFRYLANGYTYLGFNLKRKKFQDKRVRQAISYAINKDEIIEGVLLGYGQAATGPFKPGTWAHNPDVKRYPYDPEKAKKLLAEAGWKDTDNDGVLDKDGKPFDFAIITNQGNAQRKKAAEIIQRRLKEVGIAVDIRVIEWSSFIKEFINKREFDATILGWALSPEPDQYDIWHSSKTAEAEFNFVHYKNDEVDGLLEKGRRTFNQAERQKHYHRMQEILAEDQPYVFLYVAESLMAVNRRIKGIELHPNTTGISYRWPHKWWIPKPLQKYGMAQ